MWKVVGILLFGAGIMGEIQEWIKRNKERQKRLDEMLVFLKKARYAMEQEKVRWIPFFKEYQSADKTVTETLHEVGACLEQHIYPYGEEAWKAVFLEKKRQWDCSETCFEVLTQMGCVFFGRSRQENEAFMDSCIRRLEECKAEEKKKFAEEKKVWIPVSVLGSMMFVIMLL
uniref:hypothetical protein n=1 Tax=Agathobacter sp. TaxID=2021311 RepID=UPI004056694C